MISILNPFFLGLTDNSITVIYVIWIKPILRLIMDRHQPDYLSCPGDFFFFSPCFCFVVVFSNHLLSK